MTDDQSSSTSRRRFLSAAGGAAATAALAGCAGGDEEITPTPTGEDEDMGTGTDMDDTPTDAEEDFRVVITQGQPPSTLDPQNHRETTTDNVVLHAYEGLTTRERTGEAVPALGQNPRRVEPGRIQFDVREGVTFHNGDELTPEDVAFSINRIVDPEVGIESGQADQLAGVTGAAVVEGERAVEVTSDGLNPIVFSLFASYCDVMQRSWVEAREESEIAQQMNGTGPFMLDSYEENVVTEMVAYDDYWGGRAEVDGLEFRGAEESSTRVNQLVNGESDVIVNVPPQEIPRLQEESSTSVAAEASTRIIYNGMRYDVEPFSSQQFRQAMNYAVDLDAIIENVLDGFADPTGQPTLEGFVGHDPDVEPYPYDVAEAERLVEESGHAGVEITLETPVGRYLRDIEIAQAVAGYIDDLSNVSCEVQQREFNALAGELTDGDITTSPPFFLIGWGNTTFDASQTLIPLVTTDGVVSAFSDEELDSLIEQSQNTGDRDEREQLLQDANARAHDQATWIFLNRQYSVYGISGRVDWQARADERIDAYEMSPAQ